jgi:hypothetical protein
VRESGRTEPPLERPLELEPLELALELELEEREPAEAPPLRRGVVVRGLVAFGFFLIFFGWLRETIRSFTRCR